MKLLLASVLVAVTFGAAPSDQTFVGIISDNMCEKSHAAMRMGDTDAECTHACIEEHGGTYVLVDAEHVYQLSDQTASKASAGKKVTVVGTLDAKTSTITVASITPS